MNNKNKHFSAEGGCLQPHLSKQSAAGFLIMTLSVCQG
jgi:hypothetical protein